MKRALCWLVTLFESGVMQFFLAVWVYPALYDSALAKQKLVSIGVWVSVAIGIVFTILYCVIYFSDSETDGLSPSHLFSLVVCTLVSAIFSIVVVFVLDFLWMVLDNFFGIAMSILIAYAMIIALRNGFRTDI